MFFARSARSFAFSCDDYTYDFRWWKLKNFRSTSRSCAQLVRCVAAGFALKGGAAGETLKNLLHFSARFGNGAWAHSFFVAFVLKRRVHQRGCNVMQVWRNKERANANGKALFGRAKHKWAENGQSFSARVWVWSGHTNTKTARKKMTEKKKNDSWCLSYHAGHEWVL